MVRRAAPMILDHVLDCSIIASRQEETFYLQQLVWFTWVEQTYFGCNACYLSSPPWYPGGHVFFSAKAYMYSKYTEHKPTRTQATRTNNHSCPNTLGKHGPHKLLQEYLIQFSIACLFTCSVCADKNCAPPCVNPTVENLAQVFSWWIFSLIGKNN
jgi:hypothetical protein